MFEKQLTGAEGVTRASKEEEKGNANEVVQSLKSSEYTYQLAHSPLKRMMDVKR